MEAAAATRQDLLDSSNLVVLGTWCGNNERVLPALTAEASEAEASGGWPERPGLRQMALFQDRPRPALDARRSLERADACQFGWGCRFPTVIYPGTFCACAR